MNTNENYLKAERQEQIQALIQQQGRATVPQLSAHFGVSRVTIRRDLEELARQGRVERAHGGALRARPVAKEPPLLQRMEAQRAEKQRIGRVAAALIREGETVFLSSGTTVLEVARQLPKGLRLTVITNSLPVANELAGRPEVDLVVIGGLLRKSELSMIGHVAEASVREFRAERVFMGMAAIDLQQGFTGDDLLETTVDRAILTIAPQLIVVAGHQKFGRVSPVFLAPLSAAHSIITDRDTPQAYITGLRELGIQVLLV